MAATGAGGAPFLDRYTSTRPRLPKPPCTNPPALPDTCLPTPGTLRDSELMELQRQAEEGGEIFTLPDHVKEKVGA